MSLLSASVFAGFGAWAAMTAQAEPEPLVPTAQLPDPGTTPTGPSAAQEVLPGDLAPLPPPLLAEAALRLSLRPGADPGPTAGIGVGLTLGGRWASLGNQVELLAALDFGYAQHRKDVDGSRTLSNGTEVTFGGQRLSSENTFGGLQIFSLRLPYVHPWVGVGGGLAISYFSSDEKAFRPGAKRSFRPYGQVAAGFGIPIGGKSYLDVRVDYHAMSTAPEFVTTSGARAAVFGDLMTFGLAYGNRLP